jgi:hypothetical protein
MSIIAHLGSNVKEYREKSQEILEGLLFFCQKHHKEKMCLHAQYKRTIKETKEEIWIKRLICHKCDKTVSIIPDFLQPNKHYSANEIESVIIQAETTDIYDIETAASVYTVRRWIKTVRNKVATSISLLKSVVLERVLEAPSETQLAGLSLFEQVKLLAQHLPKVKNSGNTLGLADILTGYSYLHTLQSDSDKATPQKLAN